MTTELLYLMKKFSDVFVYKKSTRGVCSICFGVKKIIKNLYGHSQASQANDKSHSTWHNFAREQNNFVLGGIKPNDS